MSAHNASRAAARFLPSIFLLLFVIGYVVTAYLTLDVATRRVALLTAYLTFFLIVLDVVTSLLPRGVAKKSMDSSGRDGGESSPPLAQEVKVLLSVVGLVIAIYLAGFYVAVPLYLVVTIGYLGQQSMRLSLVIAFMTSLAIYLAFDLTLGYQVFPGILLS